MEPPNHATQATNDAFMRERERREKFIRKVQHMLWPQWGIWHQSGIKPQAMNEE